MQVIKIIQEKMQQNSYIIISGRDAILIDAGVFVGNIEENLKMYSDKPELKSVFLTHAHFDHIQELDNIVAKYNCTVYIHKSGKTHLYDEKKNVSTMDIPIKVKTKKGIKTFVDGQEITIGDIVVKCYNTPGHSIDSSCFVIEDSMFTGDTVFKIERGRTDLYSGDENVLRISLERILNDISVGIEHFYAGHGSNFDKDDLRYNITRILGEE